MVTNGEQGIGNAHGGKYCGGVVNTHNVSAAQNGSGYNGSVSGGEKGGMLWVRFALAH